MAGICILRYMAEGVQQFYLDLKRRVGELTQLNLLKKPALKLIRGTVVEKVLRDHNILRDDMM